MTLLDYYLWGAVKDKCYADKPATIDTLKYPLSIKKWTDCVGYCMASEGSHLNEFIFHYQPEGLYFQINKEI